MDIIKKMAGVAKKEKEQEKRRQERVSESFIRLAKAANEEARKRAEAEAAEKALKWAEKRTEEQDAEEAKHAADNEAQLLLTKANGKRPWLTDWEGLAKKQESEKRPAFKDFRSTETQWDGSPFRAELLPSELERHMASRRALNDLVNEEVDKYFGEALRQLKALVDLYRDMSGTTSTGLPMAGNAQYLAAVKQYEETKRQADAFKTELLTIGDANSLAAQQLAGIGFDSDIIKNQTAKAKTAYDKFKSFTDAIGKNPVGENEDVDKRLHEFKSKLAFDAYDTLHALDTSTAELDRLVTYMNTLGMPDDINQLPKGIKEALLKYAPQLANVEDYKLFVADNKLDDATIRDYAAYAHGQLNQIAGNSGKLPIDYALLALEDQQVWNDVLRTMLYPDGKDSAWGISEVRKGIRKEIEASDRAVEFLQKAKHYKEVSDYLNKIDGFWGKAAAKMGKAVTDTDVLDLLTGGIPSLTKSVSILNLKDKFESGQPLNKSERDLLEAMAIESQMSDQYGGYQNDLSYVITSSAIESFPYMAMFGLTAGVSSAMQAGGKAVTNKLLKNTIYRSLEKYGSDYTKRRVLSVALKRAAMQPAILTANRVGTVLGDMGYAALLSNTLLGAKTAKTAIDLHTGSIDYEITPNIEGRPITITGFKDGMDWGSAIYQAEGRYFVDNVSEMFGGYQLTSKLFNSIPKGTQLSKIAEITKKAWNKADLLSYNKYTSDFAKAAKWNGFWGELGEEEIAIPMSHLIGVNDATNEDGTKKTLFEEMFDLDQQLSTVGSIGLSMFTMGLLSGAGYGISARKFSKAKAKAKAQFGDNWNRIESAILAADDHNTTAVVVSIMNTLGSQKDREALLDYHNSLLRYRGASMNELKKREAYHDSRMAQMLDKAEKAGYFETDDERRLNILLEDLEKAKEVAAQNVINLFLLADQKELEAQREELMSFTQNTMDNERASDQAKEQAAAYLSYLNLSANLMGLRQRKWDDIQIEKDEMRDHVFNNLADEDGYITFATVGNDRVSIVRGNLNTDENVIVFNMKTQLFEKVKSSDIDKDSVTDPLSAAEVVFVQQQHIEREHLEAEQANAKDFDLVVGTTHQLEDGRELTVLGSSRDGGLLYTMHEEGKEDTVQHASRQGLQDIIDNIKTNRVTTLYNGTLEKTKREMYRANPVELEPQTEEEYEAVSTPTSYKRVGNVKETGDRVKDYAAHFNNAQKVLWAAQTAKTFTDFIKALYEQGLGYDTRTSFDLFKSFNALKKGNITAQQFTGIFMPEYLRSEDTTKALEDVAIDWDGTVSHPKEAKAQTDKISVEQLDTIDQMVEGINSADNIDEERAMQRDIRARLPIGAKLVKRNGVWKVETTPKVSETAEVKPNAKEEPKVVEKSPQQKTVDAIFDKIADDKQHVKIEKRTSHDYFIEVDGKLKLYKRTHSILDPQYKPDPVVEKAIATYTEMLKRAYDKGFKEFRIAAKKLTNGLANIDDYIQYIQDNPDELNDVFEAIADIAVTTSKPVLKNEYKGKLIYVQDGGGKSLIKKYNPDVVDSDEILKEIVGKYVTEGDKTFDRVPQEYRGQAMDEYNAKIRAAHNAGKTVLTANIQMLPEADVVIYNNSATDTMNRTNDEARDNRFRGEARAKKHTEEVNKFLEEHPDVESHKLSPGQYASDVLTTLPKKPELLMGSYIDEIYRSLFTKEETSFDMQLSDGTRISDHMTKDTFDLLLEDVAKMKSNFERAGWTIITEPVYVYGEVYDKLAKKVIRVAGETDMLAVDTAGNVHILDFKTSKYDFGKGFRTQLSGQSHSTKEHYQKLLTMYQKLASVSTGMNISGIKIIPIQISYDSNMFINNINTKSTIKLDYDQAILDRFLNRDKNEGLKDLKKIADTYKAALAELSIDRSTVPNISSRTKVLLDWFDEIIKAFNAQYDDAETVQDYQRLIQKYEWALNHFSTIVEVINDEETAVLKELSEKAAEKAKPEKKTVTEKEYYESDYTKELLELMTINSALYYNIDDLKEICRRIQQEHWNEDPTKVPEPIRLQIELILSNVDTLLPSVRDIDARMMVDYVRAKDWLRRTLSVTGSTKNPNVPKSENTPVYKTLVKVTKEDLDACVDLKDPNFNLSRVSNRPDFIKNAKFALSQKTENGKSNPFVYVTIEYGGHVFTPMKIWDNGANHKFYHAALEALGNAEQGERVIIKTIRRTRGDFDTGDAKSIVDRGYVSTKQGTAVPSLYDIEYSGNQELFCVVDHDGPNLIARRPGTGNKGKATKHIYPQGVDNLPVPGTMVYMMRLQYEELDEKRRPVVPISLINPTLTQEDAQLIIDILTGLYVLDKKLSRHNILNAHFYLNNTDMGVTCRDVLSKLIPYGNANAIGKNVTYCELDQNNPNILHIKGHMRGDNAKSISQIPDRTYDLTKEEDIAELKKDLTTKLSKQIDLSFAQGRLGDNEKITKLVNKHGRVLFGKSSIVFDKEDIQNPNKPEDKQGLSGLGWYAKRGFLQSNVNGFKSPYLSFDGVETEREGTVVVKAQDTITSPEDIISVDALTPNVVDDAAILGDLNMTVRTPKKDINEDEARANLNRIFGENGVRVEFNDTFYKVTRSGWHRVALCNYDSIVLTSYAERGAEYHEAFHRVVELFLTKKLREKVYAAYRKVMKKPNMTEKEVREGLSDQFKYYAMNTPTMTMPHSIKELMRNVKAWVTMLREIGSWRLFWLYTQANRGHFADRTPSQEQLSRFKEVTPLHLKVRDHSFKDVANEYLYKELVNSLAYMFLQKDVFEQDWYGTRPENIKINDEALEKLQQSAYWKAVMASKNVSQATKDLLKEVVENFDDVAPDVVAYLSQFGTESKQIFEEQSADRNDDGTDPDTEDGSEFDHHTKSSYEFHPFTRVSLKVKWFFAGIPEQYWDAEGNLMASTNSLGLKKLMNPKQVYVKALSALHEIKSVEDLLEQCKELAKQDPMFGVIYNRINPIYEASDTDADKEGFITQLFIAIKQTKNDFDTIMARKVKDGGYTFSIISQDRQHASRDYSNNWFTNFTLGGSAFVKQDGNGDLVMREKANGEQYSPDVFYQMYQRMSKYKYLFSPIENKEDVVIRGRKLDENNPADVAFVKKNIVLLLNSLGITYNAEMFDYMLLHRYGSIGKEGLVKLFEDSETVNVMKFFTGLNGIINGNKLSETVNDVPLKRYLHRLFTENGFAKELANWKYEYEHERDELMVLAVGGNRFYVMSENNLITDRMEELEDPTFLAKLSEYDYNITEQDGGLKGSIVIKHKLKGGGKLKFHTLVGFKSDQRGDQGIDYTKLSKREDYLSKAAILQSGRLLLPTLSDKKTYGYIDGITIPGLRYSSRLVTANGSNLNPTLIAVNGEVQATIGDTTVDQLIEYAVAENAAIRKFLDEEKTHPGRVKNFHEGIKVKDSTGTTYKVRLGGRFNFMLGVYEGNVFHSFNKLYDENGVYIDEETLWNDAQDKFFNKTKEELRDIVRNIITQRAKQELKKLEDLGLVKRSVGMTHGLLSYENEGLDSAAILAIYKALYENREDKSSLNVEATNALKRQAVATYVTDIVAKHIISMQETARILSGNPAFFNHQYDEKGRLVDIMLDYQKRLGGLSSTGANNNPSIKSIPKTYRCAEIKDVKIVSEHLAEFAEKIYDGELRYARMQLLLDQRDLSFDSEDKQALAEVREIVYSETLEQAEKALGNAALNIVKKRAENKTNAFKRVTVADGASYISDKMCENLLRLVGSWNKEIERAFKILRGEEVDGKRYTTKDIRQLQDAYQKVVTTVIGTQKYTAYGYRFQNGVSVPYYNKTALFPLFKSIATGKMAVIYEAMLKLEVDMMMLDSAVKVGSQNAQSFDDIINGKPFSTYEQEYAYLRKQFNTDPKDEELRSMGTQMTKVALQSLMPGLEYNLDGETVSATQIRYNIMDCLNKLSNMGVESIKKRFFTDGKVDINKVSDVLTKELARRGASREELKAVEVVIDNVDGEEVEQLRVPLDAQSSANWIQSIINSIINQEVIDVNTYGSAFFLRSVLGMEGGHILDDSNLPPSINNGDPLLTVNEHGSMDCVLSIDFFFDLLKKAGLGNASFDEQKQWLVDNGIIGGKSNLIGYRIPTQATSSIHAMRCVDVLPVVRDTIILPAEFTAITGSDFDIDKIFIASIQYDVKEQSDFATEEKYGVTTTDFTRLGESKKVAVDFAEDTVEHTRNQLILNYLAILCNSDKAIHLLNGSIDKDTDLLKDIRDEIEKSQPVEELEAFTPFTLSSLSETKDEFIAGKFGIGPFALNNNSHILTMLYGVEFNEREDGLLTRLGMTSLHESTDRYGLSIMSWLSGLINAHVDVAKDPFIHNLGVNIYTYNLVNLMIRTGFGKDTFYFTTQPIMKAFSEAYSVASGVYMLDKTLSKSKRQALAIEDVWKKAIQQYYGVKVEYEKLKDAKKAFAEVFATNHKVSVDSAVEALLSGQNDVLHQISISGITDYLDKDHTWTFDVNGKNVTLTTFEVQMLVAQANDDFKPYANQLSNLVKHSKIDTKKQGKNITQQRIYEQGYNKVFVEGKAFKADGLERMRTQSYIETKTTNALGLFKEIIGSQLIEGTQVFEMQLKSMLRAIGKPGTLDENVIKLAANAIKSEIKAGYFFGKDGFCERYSIDPKKLVSGNETMYDRLQRLQALIMGDPAYVKYREADGSPKNYVLKNLIAYKVEHGVVVDEKDGKSRTFVEDKELVHVTDTMSDTYPNAKFIRPFRFLSDDPVEADLFTQGWYELLSDNGFEEGQKFARDLIVYSFITSGANGGRFDLFKYVPNEWKENAEDFEHSYVKYMQDELRDYQRMGGITNTQLEDAILNNWFNDDIVPTYRMTDDDNHSNFTSLFNDERNGYPLVLAAVSRGKHRDYAKIEAYDKDGNIIAPKYIKIKRTDGNMPGQRNFVVYKLAYIHTNNRGYQGKPLSFPVYEAVDPKGVRYAGGETIYEYGYTAADKSEIEQSVKLTLVRFITNKENDLDVNKFIQMFDPNDHSHILERIYHFINTHEDVEERYKLLDIAPVTEYLSEGKINAEEVEESELDNTLIPPATPAEGTYKPELVLQPVQQLNHGAQLFEVKSSGITQVSDIERKLGRKPIRKSDAPYMTEHFQFSMRGKTYDDATLNRFLSVLNQIVDLLFLLSVDEFVQIPISEYDKLIQVDINKQLSFELKDGDFVNYENEQYHKQENAKKTITIPKKEYELLTLIYNNLDYVEFISEASPESSAEDIIVTTGDKYKDVSQMTTKLVTTTFHDGFEDIVDDDELQEYLEQSDIVFKYRYTDSRLLELFDFNDTNEYPDDAMKHCKGD